MFSLLLKDLISDFILPFYLLCQYRKVSGYTCSQRDNTRLTMDTYYISQLINVSLRVDSYFTKCIGNNTNCIGVVTKPNQMGTNTVLSVTNTLRKVTLTQVDHIVNKRPNIIHSQSDIGVWFGNQVYTRFIKHMHNR